MPKLPINVIEQDRALEQATDKASVALMQHRWHWTLDESNPDRVSVTEYARAVGVKPQTIHKSAHAFAIFSSRAENNVTIEEAAERAGMGAETQAAVQAVAATRGIGFGYASKEFRDEARHVREIAREQAEVKGTTVVEEIPRVAATINKARAAEKAQREVRRSRHTLRYIEVERYLTKARRQILAAVQASERVEFDHEERELLGDTLDNIKRLLALLDRSIAGSYDTAWKAELKVLEGGKAS